MTNLPTPAEVAELRRVANDGFTQAIDPDRILSICNAVDRLREVAVIAEGLYRRDRYTVVGFDRRWLAIRDAVLLREESRRDLS